MAIEFRLTGSASLRCRFAVSAIGETGEALRSLSNPDRESYHLPWQRQVRPTLAGLGLEPLLALMPAGSYQPDFLAPPPTGPQPDIEGDLQRVVAVSPDQVADEIARCRQGWLSGDGTERIFDELLEDPGATRDRMAELLRIAWTALIVPWWPQLRDVLDADITVRARQLADQGVVSVLNDLHPKVRWNHDAVTVAHPGPDQRRTVADEGIVLLPSVFAWPSVGVMLDPPWQPTISYPARGIAAIWRPGPRRAGDLARLLGSTRATVLSALVESASTSGLAARCALPVSTVSEHLAILRAGGLVTSVRVGRSVLHQRTPLGVALAGPAD